MSTYAKREAFFEKLSRGIVESGSLDAFFEKVTSFREEILKAEDLSGVYSFRQLCASLHEDQLAELKNFRGDFSDVILEKFFNGLVITPHLMFRLAVQAGDQCLHERSKADGLALAEMLRGSLDGLDVSGNDERHLVVRSLRKLATVLAGTGFDHAFAEDILQKPIGGQFMHSSVIKAYLAMDEREVIDHTPGDDLAMIDVEPRVAESAMQWLRKNQPRIVDMLVDGGLSPDFNADLAALAQRKGFTSLAWMIMLRQMDYQPDEILQNVINFGAHPDRHMIKLLEEKRAPSSTKSQLDSNAALIAYCFVHNAESSVSTECKNLKVAQRNAIREIANLGLEPHSSREPAVQEIASRLIDSANEHEDVRWLSKLVCLEGMLKTSRKYQGMRLESDLGM